jgi:hypothetical protein
MLELSLVGAGGTDEAPTVTIVSILRRCHRLGWARHAVPLQPAVML